MPRTFCDAFKSFPGPFAFGSAIPNFGNLNLLSCPSCSTSSSGAFILIPGCFTITSLSGRKTSTSGSSALTSGSLTLDFEKENLGSVNLGFFKFSSSSAAGGSSIEIAPESPWTSDLASGDVTSTLGVSRFTSASGVFPPVLEKENFGNDQFGLFILFSTSTVGTSGIKMAPSDSLTSTLGNLISALASGNVTSTSFFDKLKSISGPFTFGMDMPNFGILNLLPGPSISLPLAFKSTDRPSVSMLCAVTSTVAPSILMSLSTSGTSTTDLWISSSKFG
ncbi:hypothetical protein FQN60_012677 [Etheostoma spectabile]|uniref:Uncharacterized protein n=1 Tax=Etheostoma spectabile TaxID=54343 RepID=A0A5J5D3L4_9PERO|nr:hypothetical protein FQN60_012677 [Etheostoma spectabile]